MYAQKQNSHLVNKLFSSDTELSSSQTSAEHSPVTLQADLGNLSTLFLRIFSNKNNPDSLKTLLARDTIETLRDIRKRHDPLVWQNVIIPAIRQQQAFKFLKETDILTFHQQNKPRGYDGDANIIDMLYYEDIYCPTPKVSAACFEAFYESNSAKALRTRKGFFEQKIQSQIEAAVKEKKKRRIFSIAGGKMRELKNLLPLIRQHAKYIEIVVLDQDKVSLETLWNEYIPQLPQGTIRIANKKIAELLKGNIEVSDLGQFHMVYAAGLFDYLRQGTGTRLASLMFDFLEPSGDMYITNYSVYSSDSGYMDSILDWSLIYRSEAEVKDLARDIPRLQVKHQDIWIDNYDCIIYSSISKNTKIPSKL